MDESADNMNRPMRAEPVILAYESRPPARMMGRCWRKGNLAVFNRKFENVPMCCFKCGAPTGELKSRVIPMKKRGFWDIGRRVDVALPLCPRHEGNAPRLFKRTFWLLAAGFAMLLFGIMGDVYWVIGGALVMVLSPVMLIWVKSPARATAYDERYVILEGADEAFLEKMAEDQED